MHIFNSRRSFLGRIFSLALVGGMAPALLTSCGPAAAEKGDTKAKAWPVAQPAEGQQVATFAGGCFWSIEHMFSQLKGVAKAEAGYAGGKVVNPTYEQVCSANTGHAEAVNVIFDPKVITYRELVEVFLTIHDPTTLNRQGADEGPQYRSAIFFRDETQKKDAQAIIKKFTDEKHWPDPIVTKVEPFKNFYRAEDYHLNYFNLNPNQPYCARVVAPKIEKFQKAFKAKLK